MHVVQNEANNNKSNTSLHMALHNIVDEVVHGEVVAQTFVLQLVDNTINEELNSDKQANPTEHSSSAIPETQSKVPVMKDDDLDDVAKRDIHITGQTWRETTEEEQSFKPYL
ncbi:hypothetical protein TSUD_241080 [Trifolium subterraneum]|uniref:Uncharacterized protein n=1 Tax=Trifolium subterraneum TaxID=3900 RepID=A0A2Z6P8M0_TRISU|nr:hypothetical protein TSUD_241080 [Trifolium subterraneum]